MKIACLVTSTDDNSGTNLQGFSQATLFREAGHNVNVYAATGQEKSFGMPVETFKYPFSIPILGKPWRNLFSLLPRPLHLPLIQQSLESLQYADVIIGYAFPLNWLGYYAKQRHGTKYIWSIDGVCFPKLYELPYEKLYFWLLNQWLWKKSGTNADLVTVETDFLKELIKQRFGIESIVVGSFIDLSSFNQDVSGEEVRDLYHLGDNPLVLYIDRLETEKGIEILLESFSLVRKVIPNARLMLIGKYRHKSYWKRIQKLADESVIFIDYVPHTDLPAFYAASTIFATCATWEDGFSHTIVEAEACGKPVVAFNVGSHGEVVKSGETGILVTGLGNAQEFASAVVKLLSDQKLAKRTGEKAAKRAKELATRGISDIQGLLKRIEAL